MDGEDKIKTCPKCDLQQFGKVCGCSFWAKGDEKPLIAETFERAIQCYKYISLLANDSSPMFGYNPTGICMTIYEGNEEDMEKLKELMAKELKKEIKE